MDNYYKILGVKNFAPLDEIKTAHKKLAKKFHPDVNDGDKFFEEKFKELQKVYEVLTNEASRKIYDENLKGFFNILAQIQRHLSTKRSVTPTQGVKKASSYVFEKGRFVKRRRF